MKDWYTIYLAKNQQHQDDIKIAEQFRLAKAASPTHPALKLHQRLFMALGLKMVQWGTRLQAHYKDLSTAPLRDYASEPPCG